MEESRPTRPETVGGTGELADEAYARRRWRTNGFPFQVVGPFNTYGPRQFEGDPAEVIPRASAAAGRRTTVVLGGGVRTGPRGSSARPTRPVPGSTGDRAQVAAGASTDSLKRVHRILRASTGILGPKGTAGLG